MHLVRSDKQKEAGSEESGYQFQDMEMISIDTPGWCDATEGQPDWIPLIMNKQAAVAVEHAEIM